MSSNVEKCWLNAIKCYLQDVNISVSLLNIMLTKLYYKLWLFAKSKTKKGALNFMIIQFRDFWQQINLEQII